MRVQFSSTMSGIALSSGMTDVSRKKHIHVQCKEWDVTSDHSISEVPFCKVLDRVLPGRLGSYIYPCDAVFMCLDRQKTTKKDLDGVMQRERSKRAVVQHINHISVPTNEVDANGLEEPSDDDDDEFGDDDEGECDDVGDSIQWEDEDEPEWGDKSK